MSNFWTRTITGIVFIALIMGSIWAGPLVFSLVFLCVALLSLNEFFGLMSNQSIKANKYLGLFTGALAYLSLSGTFPGLSHTSYLLVPISGLIFFAELYRKEAQPMTNIAITLTGIIYAVIPFILLIHIGYITDPTGWNRGLILGSFVLTWSNDTFAYLIGSKIGRRKLFERISPKKSWEGSIGGALCTMGTAWVLNYYNPEIGLFNWLVIGLIICVSGTMGDLVESLLKRSLGVKDSGNALPGHGGWLDRFDALLLSAPFVWAYLMLVYQP